MKSLIFYFSGTGNTEFVTNVLKSGLEKRGNEVELIRAEDVLLGKIDLKNREIDISSFDRIGLGFPIYGFNAPRMILELTKNHILPNLKNGKSPAIFIYSTCAGPMYLNEIAHFRLKKELTKQGIKVSYERQFFMPANIFTAYPEEVNVLLVKTSEKKAGIMAAELSDGWMRLRDDKYLPYFFGWIYLLEQIGWKNAGKYFKVNDSCNGCGLCAENCPAGNIQMKKNMIGCNEISDEANETDSNNEVNVSTETMKPCYGNNCYVCMRCVYGCPKKAIGMGLYSFAILKNGYSVQDFVGKEIPADLSSLEKGYLRSLKKYMEQVN